MKKKLFLIIAMTFLMVVAFAFSVSAAGSTSNEFAETPDTIDGIAAPTKIGTNERVVMLGSDGLYYTFPAYYILNDNTSCSLKTNNSVNQVLGYADGTSHKNYVVRIEIPEGTTYINGNLLDYNTNLVYAKMPNTVTNTGTKVFQSCTNLETLILSNSLTIIQNDFCKGCSKLSSPIVIPATVTAIKGYCFDGCNKLTSVTNYAENLTSIDGNAFSGCPITEFNFPDNLTSIGQHAFNGAQFTEVDLPNTITSLGSGVFQGCTQLTYIRLPEQLTQLPHDFLKNTTNSSITIVVPKGCTSIYSLYTLQNSGIKTIIFTGDSDDAFVASVQEKASGWVNKIVYENHCDHYYNGVHKEDNNPCVINCDRCNTTNVPEKNPVHSLSTTITYVTFSATGTKVSGCTNEGCAHKTTTEAPALFTCLGYSTPESGNGGISIGYRINGEAILAYEEITKETVSYGLFATTKQGLGEDDIIDENGEAGNGTLIADIGNEDFAFIFIKMFGFDTEESKKAEFAIGAYVGTTKEDVTTYSYLQASEPAEGEKYAFIKYNDFVTQS